MKTEGRKEGRKERRKEGRKTLLNGNSRKKHNMKDEKFFGNPKQTGQN